MRTTAALPRCLRAAASIWTDHVELNRTTGMAARAIRLAARAAKVDDTSVVAKAALDRDDDKNLY